MKTLAAFLVLASAGLAAAETPGVLYDKRTLPREVMEDLRQGRPPAPWLKRAKAVGQDSQDQALAALYQRLFHLQDKRREAELRIDEAGFALEDLAAAYSKIDNYPISREDLEEIALNPRHPRYPNITESAKLNILEEVRQKVRGRKLSALEIQKIDRDMTEVKEMIRDHLNRRGPAPSPTPQRRPQ